MDNPEMVKAYIAQKDVSNAYKEAFVNAYVHYVEHHRLKWKKPIYKRNERLQNVPPTEQVKYYSREVSWTNVHAKNI